MVTEVVMTVWIRLVQGSEKVKYQDVDEAHRKSEGVCTKSGVLHVEIRQNQKKTVIAIKYNPRHTIYTVHC